MSVKRESGEWSDNSSGKRKSSRSCSEESRYERKSRNYRRKSSSRSSSRSRSRSRSRSSNYRAHKRRRYYGTREHPHASSVLGVFGLSNSVNNDDLYDLFSYYGRIDDAKVVYDRKTQNSRGFAFVYFRRVEDASYARRKCNGMSYFGRRIRVDYSITKRAHTPTPGVYMGFRHSRSRSRH